MKELSYESIHSRMISRVKKIGTIKVTRTWKKIVSSIRLSSQTLTIYIYIYIYTYMYKKGIGAGEFKWERRKIAISPASISFGTLFAERTVCPNGNRENPSMNNQYPREQTNPLSNFKELDPRSSIPATFRELVERTEFRAHILLLPSLTAARILDTWKTNVATRSHSCTVYEQRQGHYLLSRWDSSTFRSNYTSLGRVSNSNGSPPISLLVTLQTREKVFSHMHTRTRAKFSTIRDHYKLTRSTRRSSLGCRTKVGQ